MFIDYDIVMAKVVTSRICPGCNRQRVMGLYCFGAAGPRDDTDPMTRGRIQLERTDLRDDATNHGIAFYL